MYRWSCFVSSHLAHVFVEQVWVPLALCSSWSLRRTGLPLCWQMNLLAMAGMVLSLVSAIHVSGLPCSASEQECSLMVCQSDVRFW